MVKLIEKLVKNECVRRGWVFDPGYVEQVENDMEFGSFNTPQDAVKVWAKDTDSNMLYEMEE